MKAEIYTKDNCSFCTSAKNLMQKENITYHEFKIGTDISREEFIEQYPDFKTVPQIFIYVGDQKFYIGGFNELNEYLNKGK